jgi:hypothetical protein
MTQLEEVVKMGLQTCSGSVEQKEEACWTMQLDELQEVGLGHTGYS